MSEAKTLERAAVAALLFSALPQLGEPLEGGTFRGLVTAPDGTHQAVVQLPAMEGRGPWKDCMAWAESVGGQLPTRPAAALLYANAKSSFEEDWYWTCEPEGASSAWYCDFFSGTQLWTAQYDEGRAVAVRLISVSA